MAETLARVERWLRGGANGPPDARAISDSSKIGRTTYGDLRKTSSQRGARTASLVQLSRLARLFRVPGPALLDRRSDPFWFEAQGMRWRYAGEARSASEHRLRLAAAGAIFGEPPEEISKRLQKTWTAEDREAPRLDATALRALVRAGLLERLVVPDLDRLPALEATELTKKLADALEPLGSSPRRVHVVRNLAHRDFDYDPLAPFQIAWVAHALVAEFVAENPAYVIGIAGGRHVATFVRTIGADSSPFPEGGDRRIEIVPLTREPLDDHRFELADALAADLAERAGRLLGPDRVRAPSFLSFSYLRNKQPEALRTDAVLRVRQRYSDLNLAIFGCGDKQDDGWIRWALSALGIETERDPVTDVCLNMLSEKAEPVPMLVGGERREFLGVSIAELQRVAAARDKLALLLTSGESKGFPLVVAVRSGCVNAVVCDETAAQAALAALA
jgi:DNA-binding transcriptional regulator LsrR (DeoR family)